MASYTTERVTAVHHWSPKLFSFRTTRGRSLRFENGQFLMIGLETGGRRVVRAYSIASANYEEELEFYSIIVPHGPLTSRLQCVQRGDAILVSTKPTGTRESMSVSHRSSWCAVDGRVRTSPMVMRC